MKTQTKLILGGGLALGVGGVIYALTREKAAPEQPTGQVIASTAQQTAAPASSDGGISAALDSGVASAGGFLPQNASYQVPAGADSPANTVLPAAPPTLSRFAASAATIRPAAAPPTLSRFAASAATIRPAAAPPSMSQHATIALPAFVGKGR